MTSLRVLRFHRVRHLPRCLLTAALLLPLGACDRLEAAGRSAPASTPTSPPAVASAAEAARAAADAKAPTPSAAAQGQPVGAPTDGAQPVASSAVGVQPVATPAVMPLSAGAKTQDERNTIDVFKAAAPATVFVTQTRSGQDFLMRTVEVPAGAGTGFIWDADGHIVTNCHVALPNCRMDRTTKLSVTLFDHKKYDAKLVGVDPTKDIAVLKVTPSAPLVPIRRSPTGYKLTVGQKTIAIGNPFGLDHTLTTGVVSALGREVKGIGGVTIRDMVQTDAAINPGNSGGPLLDSQGQLIGMNTMIFSNSGSSAGIGFAVPHTVIERVVPQIIRDGRPTRIGLGVQILPDGIPARFGLEGVIVERVTRTSPASKAGLRSLEQTPTGFRFDMIVGVNEKRIRNFDDLFSALDGMSAGDKVTLSIRRMPQDKVVTLKTELVQL